MPKKAQLVFSLICILTVFGSFLFFRIGKASAATYYVDATGGNDANSGTAPSTPWQTINKVNTSTFQPGDSILFKKGETWREQLTVPSSGTAGNPITFGTYGNGNNPKINRTNNWNDWWEQSLVYNGSAELFTSGSPSDSFGPFWGTYRKGDSTGSVKADSSQSVSGEYSFKISNNGSDNWNDYVESYTFVGSSIYTPKKNSNYYLSAYGRVSNTSSDLLAMQVAIKWSDNTWEYLNSDGSWGSDSTVKSKTWNGTDANTWAGKEMTFVTPDDAVKTISNIYILFFNFNSGDSWVDDVYLMEGSVHNPVRVWSGFNSGTSKEVLGMMNEAGNNRAKFIGTCYDVANDLPWQLLTDDNEGCTDYSSNRPYFYFRKDSGKPGEMGIGALPYGIYINNKNYVTVSGIDVYGPGAYINYSTGVYGIVIGGTSHDVTIKNSDISYSNGVGITDSSTNSNIVYDGITSHDNQSTGIYMTAPYGGIKNSKSYNNCQVSNDGGDCGGIGIQTGDIYIHNNEIYHNGRDGRLNDMELSIFLAGMHDGPLDIKYNYIHDCWDGCGQIYSGGGGTTYAYNIIDGFANINNTTNPATRTYGSMSGLRLGNGGDTGGGPIYIYNNIFMNGGFDNNNHNYPSAIVIASNGYDGTQIKNNIFINNGTDISVLNKGTVGTIIDNNIYYKASKSYTKNWFWKTNTYDTFASYKAVMNALSPTQEVNSLSADPLFTSSSNFSLQSASPAINAGINVGLTSDYAGNPIVGAPDIGAYEYQGAVIDTTPPAAPTGLSVN